MQAQVGFSVYECIVAFLLGVMSGATLLYMLHKKESTERETVGYAKGFMAGVRHHDATSWEDEE